MDNAYYNGGFQLIGGYLYLCATNQDANTIRAWAVPGWTP